MNDRYNIAIYNSQQRRLLLLPCNNPVQAARFALAKYDLTAVSFINVFESGAFVFRLYVRSGAICPLMGVMYELGQDKWLRRQIIAQKPVLDWERLLRSPKKAIQFAPVSFVLSRFRLTISNPPA